MNPKTKSWIGSVLIAIGILSIIYGIDHVVAGPVYDCPDCSPFAHDVVASLRQEPNQWSETPYYLSNKNRHLEFWTANGAGYMSPLGLKSRPDEWDTGVGFGSREQRYVWTAYQEWHRKHQVPLTSADFN